MESRNQGPEEAWKGLTWGAMVSRVEARVDVCKRKTKEHGNAAKKWQAVAVPLAWTTAVIAAVSGLSVIGDQQTLAIVFSVVTAILAGTNAALNPTTTARLHKMAFDAYERMGRKFEDFSYFHAEADTELVPPERRKELLDAIQTLEEELIAIERS